MKENNLPPSVYAAFLFLVASFAVAASIGLSTLPAKAGAKNDLSNPFQDCQCVHYAYEQAPTVIKQLIKWTKGTSFDGYPPPPSSQVSWYAKDWPFNVKKYGPMMDASLDWEHAVDNTPSLGAIIVYSPVKGIVGIAGHVGIVAEIDNQRRIRVKDANWGNYPCKVGVHPKDLMPVRDYMTFIHPPEPRRARATAVVPVEKSIRGTFSVIWPWRNIWVEASTKFELWIDNKLVASHSRPKRWAVTIPLDRVWLTPLKTHVMELKWWDTGKDHPPTFNQTWWPNKDVSAAEPDLHKPLPVEYIYVVRPTVVTRGETAYLTVSADAPPFTISSVEVYDAGEHKIGNVKGSEGTIPISTDSLPLGQTHLKIVATVPDWPGRISDASFKLTVQSATNQLPAGSSPIPSAHQTTAPLQTPTLASQVSPPTLSTPTNGSSWSQSADITLRWNTSPGATQYKVELWGGPYSKMTPCNWQSGTSCHIGQMWPGTMYWHIKARSASGEESSWSDAWSFIIQEGKKEQAPTETPVPLQPGRLELVDSLQLHSVGSGKWPPQVGDKLVAHIKVRNAGEQAISVKVGVRGRRNGSDNWDIGWWDVTLQPGQVWGLDPNNERPLQSGSYSFRISYQQDGQWHEIGNEVNFTAQIPSQPGVSPPSLLSPANGSSWPQNTDITLRWNTSPGATQYKVELWGGPYSKMTPCNWQSGTSCHIGQMWPGTMYWHVKARSASGEESNWSDTWSFVIQ